RATSAEAGRAANRWCNRGEARTGWTGKQRSSGVLRAVPHAMRDHLTVNEATDLGAQLPTLIRGIYYEGWNSAKNPARMRHAKDFVAAVQAAYGAEPLGQVDHVVRAVIDLLDSHVTAGEMKDVREAFTKEIRALFGVG